MGFEMVDGQNEDEKPLDAGEQSPAEFQPRAQRFPIHVVVQYHERDDPDWHEGTTINISRTGILFQTDHELLPQTELELKVLFPAEVTGSAAMNVLCWGPVVRKRADALPGNLMIAAAIHRYRFATP
jgi:hypothetical protein